MTKAEKSKQPNVAEVAQLEAVHSEKILELKSTGLFGLILNSFKIIAKYWKPLGGILLVYLLLYVIFVNNFGLVASNAKNIKTEINLSATGGEKINTALRGYSDLVGGSHIAQVNTLMQNILLIITSLAIIWTLRQLIAGKKVDLKASFYQSTKPLIPFLLVVFVLFLELLPMTLGTLILGSIMVNFFSKSAFVISIFTFLIVLFVIWSIYMLINTIFALYIVTLPDIQPIQSIRLAKKLVKGRKLKVVANLLILVLLLLLISISVIVTLIIVCAALVPYAILLLSALVLLYAHTYLFNYYRNLML